MKILILDEGQCTRMNLLRAGKWFMSECDRESKFICKASNDIPVLCQNGYTGVKVKY
jgi:hypothetical protein